MIVTGPMLRANPERPLRVLRLFMTFSISPENLR
jgi:hypothetical protein